MTERQSKLTGLLGFAQRLLQKNITEFDATVERYGGLSGALREELEKTGGHVESIFEDENTEGTLQHQPTIVIATHETHSDAPSILAALPERRDAYVIGSANAEYILGPHAQQFYISTPVDNEPTNSISSRLWRRVHPSSMTPDEIKKSRMNTIRKAITKVREGGLVVIFPHGITKGNEWFDGIGLLLKQLPDAHVVMAVTEGTSHSDPVRLVPGVRNVAPFRAYVRFSKPRIAQEFITAEENSDRGKITDRVKSVYYKWKSGKSQQVRE